MLSIFQDCMKNVQLGNFVNFNNGCSKKKKPRKCKYLIKCASVHDTFLELPSSGMFLE